MTFLVQFDVPRTLNTDRRNEGKQCRLRLPGNMSLPLVANNMESCHNQHVKVGGDKCIHWVTSSCRLNHSNQVFLFLVSSSKSCTVSTLILRYYVDILSVVLPQSYLHNSTFSTPKYLLKGSDKHMRNLVNCTTNICAYQDFCLSRGLCMPPW